MTRTSYWFPAAAVLAPAAAAGIAYVALDPVGHSLLTAWRLAQRARGHPAPGNVVASYSDMVVALVPRAAAIVEHDTIRVAVGIVAIIALLAGSLALAQSLIGLVLGALGAGLGRGASGGDGSGGTTTVAGAREMRALGLFRPAGLYLGRYGRRSVMLADSLAESHTLIVGPSGGGKTTGLIVPMLYHEAGAGRSIVVMDPKGELYGLTAGYLGRTHRILRWAPRDPAVSDRYDPLAHVRTTGEARAFVEAWVAATGTSPGDSFYEKQEMAVLTADIVCLKRLNPQATIQTLRRFVATQTPQSLLALFEGFLETHPEEEVVASAAGQLRNLVASGKTGGGVFSALGPRFAAVESEEVQATTSGNDIDFEEIIGQPTVLYVSVPVPDAATLAPLTANFFVTLMRAVVAHGGTDAPLPRPLRLIMDEFANIGRIDGFDGMQATLRYKGVSIVLVLQAVLQLKKLYGVTTGEIIRDNCLTRVILPGSGYEDTEFFSRSAGWTTIRSRSESYPGYGSGLVLDPTVTLGYRSRPIIMPDEVRQLDNKMLVIHGRRSPLLLDLVPYYEDARMRRTLERARAQEGVALQAARAAAIRARPGWAWPPAPRSFSPAGSSTAETMDGGVSPAGSVSPGAGGRTGGDAPAGPVSAPAVAWPRAHPREGQPSGERVWGQIPAAPAHQTGGTARARKQRTRNSRARRRAEPPPPEAAGDAMGMGDAGSGEQGHPRGYMPPPEWEA